MVKRPVLKKHEAVIRAQPDRGAHTFTVMQQYLSRFGRPEDGNRESRA